MPQHVPDNALNNSPLGKTQQYSEQYNPSLLYGVSRDLGRGPLGLTDNLPFTGVDIWNVYELSWLDPTGRPVAAMAELRVPVDSPCLIESKSMKLYFNSLNMTSFKDFLQVQEVISKDLSNCALAPVKVEIRESHRENIILADPLGICIDQCPFNELHAEPCPKVLTCGEEKRSEILFSRLFRSRCPVTGQPDWATLIVEYTGPVIRPDSLLEYVVSYRRHQAFHEACVEQMFLDIRQHCRPQKLQVTARFTRRGGIDINPVRSTHVDTWTNLRTPFQ
ncbi:NADPH-dependent 7-cyano-7-deazaguanine reductase QueF [Desulfogranum japonicum]|uniref:NADPH-dependent 7-cyano-7-deazaguanine reductase QueF n=1 Tax=Desulfogranum japonicum TaxID=231447 RepID=UPI00040CEF2B|nr:NADPH-dependent 7-cyano-7-deazaguanine reductase QueF [Desulfogranum japonicum]